MECSTNVLESSGIEIIGEALPDLSPIKSIINQGGKLVTGMLCKLHGVSIKLIRNVRGLGSTTKGHASLLFENKTLGVLDNIFSQKFFKCLLTDPWCYLSVYQTVLVEFNPKCRSDLHGCRV